MFPSRCSGFVPVASRGFGQPSVWSGNMCRCLSADAVTSDRNTITPSTAAVSASCRAKCTTLPYAHGWWAGRLAQTPRRLCLQSVFCDLPRHRGCAPSPHGRPDGRQGSHTPHSGLLALPDGASTVQPCSRAVRHTIHGLGKPGTKLRRVPCSARTHAWIFRGLRVLHAAYTRDSTVTGCGPFPRVRRFSQGARARAER